MLAEVRRKIDRKYFTLMPRRTCVLVSAPLMPEVAFVELPPKNPFLSRRMTLPPFSNTECAADKPDKPPPTTITWAMKRSLLAFSWVNKTSNSLPSPISQERQNSRSLSAEHFTQSWNQVAIRQPRTGWLWYPFLGDLLEVFSYGGENIFIKVLRF